MSEELKACPFCNSSNVAFDEEYGNTWIVCKDCLSASAVFVIADDGKYRAVKAWNTRPREDNLKSENEMLRATIQRVNREFGLILRMWDSVTSDREEVTK